MKSKPILRFQLPWVVPSDQSCAALVCCMALSSTDKVVVRLRESPQASPKNVERRAKRANE